MRKKLISFLVAAALVFCMFNCMPYSTSKASDPQKISFEVTYKQTEARKMLDMLNEFRAANGANEAGRRVLEYDYDLEKVAMQRAAEIAVKFDTDDYRPDGKYYKQTLADYKFDITPRNFMYGENILYGTENSMGLENAFDTLCTNSTNRQIMLGYFTAVGISHIKMEDKIDFWVQVFADEGKNFTYVAPIDGKGIATVKVSSSLVENVNVSYTSGSTTVAEGETVDVPVYTPVVKFKESELENAVTLLPLTFESDDGFVQASGSTMTGLKAGTGTISTDFFGQTYSYSITVTGGSGNNNQTPTDTPTNTPTDTPSNSLAKGETFVEDGVKYRVTAANKVEVTGLSFTKATSAEIPDTVKHSDVKYSVVKIAASAFEGYTSLKTIKLGKNIKSIGTKAFKGCSALTNIEVPGKVTSIGKQAFYGCKKISSISLTGKAISKIGSKAFSKINSKVKIQIPASKEKAYKKLLKSGGLSSSITVETV